MSGARRTKNRYLVIGHGSIGRRHAKNLTSVAPGAEVVCVGSRAVGAAPQFPGIPLDPMPAAAIVANPAPVHVAVVRHLLSARVPVLVEKPLAADPQEARAIVDLAEDAGVPVLVGYVLRFFPPLQALRAGVAEGWVGRPFYMRAEVGQHLDSWRPDRDVKETVTARADLGGGVLLELSHELDYAGWVLGPVRSVQATAVTIGDMELEVQDLAEITLRFDSGAVGSVHLDLLQRSPRRICRIDGTAGTVELDLLSGHLRRHDTEAGWTNVQVDPVVDRNELYLAELRHFLDCVERGALPAVTPRDALLALDVADAARRSSDLGTRVDIWSGR